MYTSYFKNPNLNPQDSRLVSIARWTPPGFRNIRQFRLLVPRKDWGGQSPNTFIRTYYEKVLDRLDPRLIYDSLEESILLCWEPPGVFCHRRIVAEWLEQHLAIKVPELPANYNPKQKDLFEEGGQT